MSTLKISFYVSKCLSSEIALHLFVLDSYTIESNEEGSLTADRHSKMTKRNLSDIDRMEGAAVENLFFTRMFCRAFCAYLNKSFDPPTGRQVEM